MQGICGEVEEEEVSADVALYSLRRIKDHAGRGRGGGWRSEKGLDDGLIDIETEAGLFAL